MILVAGLALALVILALAGMNQGSTSEQIVARLASEKDPRIVTAAAQVLDGRGMKLTAEVLRARARDLAAAPPATGAGVSGTTEQAEPAIPVAASDTWARFERALTCAPPGARSPSGRLGMLAIHLRRLQELGYVGRIAGTSAALTADWTPPLREVEFLADPSVQRRVLAESTAAFVEAIARRHPFAIGQMIDGRPASLSGLLAVAHRLGIAGLTQWLCSENERRRQRIATASFGRANGIF